MEKIKAAFVNRIGKPILRLLRQGTSPDRLAASFALGAVIGVFPLLGATTAICTALALVLRLNLPVIQLANYIVYPLQLALLIPFVQWGAALFQVPPPAMTLQELKALFSAEFWATAASFLGVFARAAAVWLAASVPVFVAAYAALALLFRRLGRRQASIAPATTKQGAA
jgi:uncharacterized protein (DUF2062 family)